MFGETRKRLGSAKGLKIIGGLLLFMGAVDGLRMLLPGEPFSWWRGVHSLALLYVGGATLHIARKQGREENVK